jgi:hypothetical protein
MNPPVRYAMCFVLVWTGGAPRLRQLNDVDFEFVNRGAMLTIFVPAMLLLFSCFFIPSPFAESAIALAVLWGTVSLVKVLQVLAAEKVRRISGTR